MRTITRDDVLTALDEAVAEKGADYVYPARTRVVRGQTVRAVGGGCDYVRDGAPSCIAANALHRLGVPVEVLVTFDENDGVGVGVDLVAREVRDVAHVDLGIAGEPRGPLVTLRWAQRAQDNGKTWGEAVAIARREG